MVRRTRYPDRTHVFKRLERERCIWVRTLASSRRVPFNESRNVGVEVVMPVHLRDLIDRRVKLGKVNRSACIRRWIKRGIALEVAEEEAARAKAVKETP